MLTKRFARWVFMVLVLVGVTSVRPATGTVSQDHVGTLFPDKPIFWDGVLVKDSLNVLLTPDGCVSPTVTCIDYTLGVAEKADILRIALDDPEPAPMSAFELHLYNPDGELVKSDSLGFSVEIWVDKPQRGTWTARLVAGAAKEDNFRMRAILQNRNDTKTHDQNPVPLLPNLRILPPFEFTFELPATLIGPGIDLDDKQATSCHADETALFGVTRCLRFSLGPGNDGEGRLHFVFEPVKDGTLTGPVRQIITMSDGNTRERTAGTYRYHETHAHYHHEGFGTLELFRVVNEKKGELQRVGDGPKQGFCLQPFKILNWRSFAQAPPDRGQSRCEQTGTLVASFSEGTDMRLSAGWADIYGWSLPGNFVDFGSNGDGRYVVQSEADPDNVVLESDDSDNAGYTYIEVRGTEIDVLERGFGESPWDPHKKVINDWVYENPDDRLPYQPS